MILQLCSACQISVHVCCIIMLQDQIFCLEQEVLLCEDSKISNLGNGDKQIERWPDHPGSHRENHVSQLCT